jgi:hypothetical protein
MKDNTLMFLSALTFLVIMMMCITAIQITEIKHIKCKCQLEEPKK